MHIFIDESGSFVRSAARGAGVSVVGALVLPSCTDWLDAKMLSRISAGLDAYFIVLPW